MRLAAPADFAKREASIRPMPWIFRNTGNRWETLSESKPALSQVSDYDRLPSAAGAVSGKSRVFLSFGNPSPQKQKGSEFIGALDVFRNIVHTTNTICQNPFAALSAGAKSG